MYQASAAKQEPVVIKKYANRRLYDTETSAYITLEDLCERVKDGKDFIVVDAKTGQDLTRQLLTQIIFEQETKGNPLLPIDFLRNVIRFYDDKMNKVLQHYLDASIRTFMGNQDRMRSAVGKAVGDFSPLNQIEEMTRNNVALFEKAVTMFTPFNYFSGQEQQEEQQKAQPAAKRRRQNY